MSCPILPSAPSQGDAWITRAPAANAPDSVDYHKSTIRFFSAAESEAALALSTIDLSSLQDAMADAGANVIILDACRNNPFADAIAAHRAIGVSRGLTPMDAKGRGLLIEFLRDPAFPFL